MGGGAAAEVRVGGAGVVEHAAASTEKIRMDSRWGNLMRDTEIEKALRSNAIFNGVPSGVLRKWRVDWHDIQRRLSE
jgi:hypothetical protein